MKKKKMIRAVVVEPGMAPRIEMIEDNLRVYQEIVGGYIDLVNLGDLGTGTIYAVIHDEGKLIGLEPNRCIGRDIIVGTFCIVKGSQGSGNFKGLTEQEAELIAEDMKRREAPKNIKVLPYMEVIPF